MVNHKLLIGTNDGFYGTLLDENGSPTRLLKSARVLRLRQLGDEIYAATRSGLFRSEDSGGDRKSTRLNSSHVSTSYAVFCLKKKTRYSDTDFEKLGTSYG